MSVEGGHNKRKRAETIFDLCDELRKLSVPEDAIAPIWESARTLWNDAVEDARQGTA